MSTKGSPPDLFTRTRRLVLKELVSAAGNPLHIRELARRAGLDPSGIGRELRNLEKMGIVKVKQSGRQKEYVLNKECPIHDELVMMVIKTAGLADEIRAALVPLESRIEKAYIYGSFATGTHKYDSDVDLMVVGDVSLKEVTVAVAETGRKLGREVNPTVFRPEDYRNRVRDAADFPGRVERGPIIRLIG